MQFHVEIEIKKESIQGLTKLYDMGNYILNMTLDTPDFDSALAELQITCKQVLAAHLQQEVDTNRLDTDPQTSHITVCGIIGGLRHYETFQLTDKLYKELREKKKSQPDKPKLNEESLQNDIEYGITMIRSIVDIKKDIAMLGVVNWQYHILNKHFGLVVPQEIINITNELGEKK